MSKDLNEVEGLGEIEDPDCHMRNAGEQGRFCDRRGSKDRKCHRQEAA